MAFKPNDNDHGLHGIVCDNEFIFCTKVYLEMTNNIVKGTQKITFLVSKCQHNWILQFEFSSTRKGGCGWGAARPISRKYPRRPHTPTMTLLPNNYGVRLGCSKMSKIYFFI
jgi:hypothetical protein